MLKPRFETLKSINAEFLDGRWTDDELEQLVTPTFGLVSSFESALAELRGILAKDLGQVGRDAPASASESGHG